MQADKSQGGVIGMLANNDDLKLTLFLRHPKKLKNAPRRSQVVQGDVLDKKQLGSVVAGQDIVDANLTGEDIDSQAKAIVEAMHAAKVKRLIFVASLGIYDEVPGKFGEWNRREMGGYLPPFRRAADFIEGSGLEPRNAMFAPMTAENIETPDGLHFGSLLWAEEIQ